MFLGNISLKIFCLDIMATCSASCLSVCQYSRIFLLKASLPIWSFLHNSFLKYGINLLHVLSLGVLCGAAYKNAQAEKATTIIKSHVLNVGAAEVTPPTATSLGAIVTLVR